MAFYVPWRPGSGHPAFKSTSFPLRHSHLIFLPSPVPHYFPSTHPCYRTMPAIRDHSVSPRKDQNYRRPLKDSRGKHSLDYVLNNDGDGLERDRLPPFSTFPSYNPSPPTTPTAATSRFRVCTPPPSPYSPLFPYMYFPVSPVPPSLCATPIQDNIPSFSSHFQGLVIARDEGNTSPPKDRGSHLLGLPATGSSSKAKESETLQVGDTRPSGSMECKWPGCGWSESPRSFGLWGRHLKHHFESTQPPKGGDVTCMWGDCMQEVRGKYWVEHIRGHEEDFWIKCPMCCFKYLSIPPIVRHLANHHRVASEDASRNGGRL